MISILLNILALLVILYVIYLILDFIRLPDQVKKIIHIIVGLIAILWLVNLLGFATIPYARPMFQCC